MITSIQILLKPHLIDVKGKRVEEKCLKLGVVTGKVKSSKLFSINYQATETQLQDYANRCIKDIVTDEVIVNSLYKSIDYQSCIAIAKLPGVTDDEGTSAQMAWVDFFNIDADVNTQHIFTQDIFYFENKLSKEQMTMIAKRLLGNPLINHFTYAYRAEGDIIAFKPYVPEVRMTADATVETVNLDLNDEGLIKLSKEKVLALNLAEMKAIVGYYKNEKTIAERKAMGLPLQPTDCELEILGQTWSEHCKHKELMVLSSPVSLFL